MSYIVDSYIKDPEGNCIIKKITREFDTKEEALIWARGFKDVDIYHS